MTVFHFLVIGATSLRLVHRWRTKRLWWDDYSAFVVLVVDIVYVVHMWLRFRYGGKNNAMAPQATLDTKWQLFFSSCWSNCAKG